MPIKIIANERHAGQFPVRVVKIVTFRDRNPEIPLMNVQLTFADGRTISAECIGGDPYMIDLRLSGESGKLLGRTTSLNGGSCCDHQISLSNDNSPFLRTTVNVHRLDGGRIFTDQKGDPNRLIIRALNRLQQERLVYDAQTLLPLF